MSTRDAKTQPFLSTSIWNIPIGAGAVYLDAKFLKREAHAPSARTSPFNGDGAPLKADGTLAPQVQIWHNGELSGDRAYPVDNPPQTIMGGNRIPLPPGLIVPSLRINDTASLVGADGNIIYEIAYFFHGTAGSYVGSNPATSAPPTPGLVTGGHGAQYGTITGEGLFGACAGSGMTITGGIFRAGEWTTAYNGGGTPLPIPHALHVDTNATNDLAWPTGYSSFVNTGPTAGRDGIGYRWPASKADGGANVPAIPANNPPKSSNNYYGGTVLQARMGSLLALRYFSNVDGTGVHNPVNGWTQGDLYVGGAFGIQTAAGSTMAQTALLYGYYPTNNDPSGNPKGTPDGHPNRMNFFFSQEVTTTLDANGFETEEFFNLYNYHFVQAVNSSGTGTGDKAAFAADMQKIITRLCVIDNNTYAQYQTCITDYNATPRVFTGAGGGAPLAPFAPDLGASALGPPFVQSSQGATASNTSALAVTGLATKKKSTLALQVTARATGGGASTIAKVGSSWTLATPQAGIANATAVLAPRNITAGNWVVVVIQERTAGVVAVASISDKIGGVATSNVWAKLPGASVVDGATPAVLRLEVWAAHVVTGGVSTITATFGSAGAGNAIASEFSGAGETLDVAVKTATAAGSTTIAPGTSLSAANGDLVIAAYATKANPAISARAFGSAGTALETPYPALNAQATGADDCQLEVCEKLTTAAATQSFTATITSGTWVAILLCISAASGGGGAAPTVTIAGGGTWVNDFAVNAPSGTANHSAWHLTPGVVVAANAVTITSSAAGSIGYEFYELDSPYVFQAKVTATGTSVSPTVSITPTATTDVQIGSLTVPNGTTVFTALPSTWTNDATINAGASGTFSELQSGANAPAVATAQTYSATIASAAWVAGIVNYSIPAATLPGTPAAPVVTADPLQPGTLTVDWTLPSGDTGDDYSRITTYVTGVSQGTTDVLVPNSIVTLSLTPSLLYTFSATMHSAAGFGTESAQSSPAIAPIPVPTMPVVTPLPTGASAHPTISAKYIAALKQP